MIVDTVFRAMAKKYENPARRDTVNQIFSEWETEINESFRTRDQGRFFRAVKAAREKLRK